METSDFRLEAVKLALKKMFTSDYFDICTVDCCLKITGAIPDKSTYDGLRAIHCVHWKDMSSSMRNEVFKRTLNMVAGEGFDMSAIDMKFDNMREAFIQVERSGFSKLLNFSRR